MMTHRTTRCAALAAWLAGVCAGVSPARAEDADTAMVDTARALYDEARVLRTEGAYDGCLAKATAAWALHQHPKIAAVRGDCALSLGRHVEAARYLHIGAESRWNNPELRDHVTGLYRRALADVATVRIQTDVAGASVSLDGAAAEPVDGPLFLEPGPHRLTVSKPGHTPHALDIDAVAGHSETIGVALPPVGVPAPHSDAPATSPAPDAPLPWWPIAAGGAVAAGALIAGVVLRAVVAPGQEQDADALRDELRASGGGCPDGAGCSELDAAYADARRSYDMSTGLLIGGGVLGAATIVYAIVLATDRDGPSVTPIAGTSAFGLQLTTRF